MRISGINHVNISTSDLEASARFYADLLALTPGDPPAVIAPDQGRWLYDHEDCAIVHLRKYDSEPGSTGAIHHVAFTCSGKADMLDRLKRHEMQYRMHEDPSSGLTQIFVQDPHGVLLELNFAGD